MCLSPSLRLRALRGQRSDLIYFGALGIKQRWPRGFFGHLTHVASYLAPNHFYTVAKKHSYLKKKWCHIAHLLKTPQRSSIVLWVKVYHGGPWLPLASLLMLLEPHRGPLSSWNVPSGFKTFAVLFLVSGVLLPTFVTHESGCLFVSADSLLR